MTKVRHVTIIWLALIAATLVAAVIGSLEQSGLFVTVATIIILIAKGQLIVDHFMELKGVARFWRAIMSAYCVVIGGFILMAYALGLSA